MRLLWLADVLRAAGLTVHEYDGWRTRGLSTLGPVRGVICHGTAGRTDIQTDLRIIAISGSGTAAAPIAQLVLARDGVWWVVASGTCTGIKTGTAGPLAGWSDDAVVQIEACHAKDEPWTEVQYRSYVRGVAALVAHREPGYDVPVERVVGHYEHQPLEKTDPWFDMATFRRDVAAVLIGDEMELGDVVTSAATADTPNRTVNQVLGDLWHGVHGRIQRVETKLDELAKRPQAPSPVDPVALKAVILDPEVLAAIAKAVVDEEHRRIAS